MMFGNAEASAPCPTCGKTTSGSEEWSTSQCDDCFLAENAEDMEIAAEAARRFPPERFDGGEL
jgi:NMD protein affecting ribosome stability and mRNA decay